MTTLLLPTSSPVEHFDGCNYAIVHIDSKELKYIDKLVSAACKNRRMYTNLVKMYFWSDVTFHDINENRLSDIKMRTKTPALYTSPPGETSSGVWC
jgi:hypothetical protein